MSEYYPDAEHNTINDQLDVTVKMLTAASALYFAHKYPMLTSDVFGYSIGKKYARVYYDMGNGQRMVAFFVELATGDVWKADGWKKPALNFTRGNITTSEGRKALTFDKLKGSDLNYFYPAF